MENDSASLFPLIINSWLKIIKFYIIVTKLEQIIKIISAFERLFCLEFNFFLVHKLRQAKMWVTKILGSF